MDYGIVYLLTNPVMPGLVKIGMTTREDIDARMNELYSTGVPVPFDCAFACRVYKSDCAKIEKALHTAFYPQRINKNREFFRIQVEQAKAILELFHHEDVTEEISDEIDNDLTEDDRDATQNAKVRRPNLNFHEMGLADGTVITFVDDPTKTAIIESERKVNLDGEVMSLTRATKNLLHNETAVGPCPHWTHNDKLLSDIYDETYPFEE